MSEESRKIRYIIRLRQSLRRWRKRAAEAAARGLLSDVPAGHVAVTVGPCCRRFVVPMTHLSHPLFQKLLLEAEEEYGFTNSSGPLAIPCPEDRFEDILRCMDRIKSNNNHCLTLSTMNPDEYRSCFHVGLRRSLNFSSNSRPFSHCGSVS